MSHVEAGPLSSYNSLTDRHLATYFSNARMRNHLIKTGLLTKQGEVVPDNIYRIKMARREHRRTIRDLLAQAIVHKTLDMERYRQVTIRQKIEEISKIELVKRVKSQRHRRGDEELIPFFSQTVMKRPKNQPHRLEHSDDSQQGKSSRNKNRNLSPESESRKRLRDQFPKEEIDTKHLKDLDGIALQEYARILERQNRVREPSPHVKRRTKSATPSKVVMPESPKNRYTMKSRKEDEAKKQTNSSNNSARGDRSSQRSKDFDDEERKSSTRGRQDDSERKSKKKTKGHPGNAVLRRTEPALMHQEKLQSLCEVTMKYFGQAVAMTRDDLDPCQEVMVVQQHCGGNTLVLFKERIKPNSNFTFISRRHRGYPFSLTFYINGVNDCRLSTCCEYKHRIGARLGGKMGHFGFVDVQGAAPCYKCQVEKGYITVPSNENTTNRKAAAMERNNNTVPRKLSALTRRKPNAVFDPPLDRQYSQMNFNSLDDGHHPRSGSHFNPHAQDDYNSDRLSDEEAIQIHQEAIRLGINLEELQELDLRDLSKFMRRKSVDDLLAEKSSPTNRSPKHRIKKSRSNEENAAPVVVSSFVDEEDNVEWIRDTNNSGRHPLEDPIEIEVESEDDHSNKAQVETIDRNRPVKMSDLKKVNRQSIESYQYDFEEDCEESLLDDCSQRIDGDKAKKSDGEDFSDTEAESLDDFDNGRNDTVRRANQNPYPYEKEVVEEEAVEEEEMKEFPPPDDYVYQVCEPICQSPQLYSITEHTEPPELSGVMENNTSDVIHIPGWSMESTNKSQEVAIASEMTLMEAKEETIFGATEDNITSRSKARKSTFGVINTVLTEDEASGYGEYELANKGNSSPTCKFQTEISTELDIRLNEESPSNFVTNSNSSLESKATSNILTPQNTRDMSVSSFKKDSSEKFSPEKAEMNENYEHSNDDVGSSNHKQKRQNRLEKSQINNNTSDDLESDSKRPESFQLIEDNISLKSNSSLSSSNSTHSQKQKNSSKISSPNESPSSRESDRPNKNLEVSNNEAIAEIPDADPDSPTEDPKLSDRHSSDPINKTKDNTDQKDDKQEPEENHSTSRDSSVIDEIDKNFVDRSKSPEDSNGKKDSDVDSIEEKEKFNYESGTEEEDKSSSSSTSSSEEEEEPVIPEYRLTTYTGKLPESGTNGQVFVRLYGENGHSKEMKLENNEGGKFLENRRDIFDLDCRELGRIDKVDIALRSNNNSKETVDWFLDKIEVQAKNGEIYEFEINHWFSSDSDLKSFRNKDLIEPEVVQSANFEMQNGKEPTDSSEPETSSDEETNSSESPAFEAEVPALNLSGQNDEQNKTDDAETAATSEESPLYIVPQSDKRSEDEVPKSSERLSTSPPESDTTSSEYTSEESSEEEEDEENEKEEDKTIEEKNEDVESITSAPKVKSISDEDIESFFENDNMMQIVSCDLSVDQLNIICECLRANHNNVTFVTLRDCPLGDDKLEILVGGLLSLKSLEFFNLNGCQITRRGLATLNQIFLKFKNSLKALIIHGNNVGDDGLNFLSNRLLFHQVNIKSLDISDTGMADQGADALVKILMSDIPLESLELTGNRNITPVGWAAIGAALGNNDKLKSLSVDYCELSSESLTNLTQSIDTNPSLIELDLEGNDIDDEGALQLVEIIKRRLSDRDIPVLKVNCRPGNLISDEVVTEFEKLSSDY